MTVIAETRVLPETLETTWQRLREGFDPTGASEDPAYKSSLEDAVGKQWRELSANASDGVPGTLVTKGT